jgi:hypothetical protein
MNTNETCKCGVRFHITNEMIREYRKWPPEMKLEWLDSAVRLSLAGLTPKRRVAWEKFRKGEI